MAKTVSLRRYSLILEKVVGDRFPSFASIKGFLERHSFEFSARTLQRDLAQMRNLFGIEIAFDREKGGYYLDQAQSMNPDTFLRFLEVTCMAQLLLDTVAEGKNALEHLSFGTTGNLTGIQWLKPLLEAVQHRRLVQIKYQSFFQAAPKSHPPIMPLLLREYLGRWYLVGQIDIGKKLYNFGLDRMLEVKVLKTHFTPDPKVDPARVYEKTIGVSNDGETSERVRLGFAPDQAKYLKTLPLHPSQAIVQDDDKEFVIDIEVIPNFELSQRILMYGESVRVIRPAWLVQEIRNSLSSALAQYPSPTRK